ncbi:hypothetical protein ABBQ32_005992 [Trebouxia sp. C0010 RCD-2024]
MRCCVQGIPSSPSAGSLVTPGGFVVAALPPLYVYPNATVYLNQTQLQLTTAGSLTSGSIGRGFGDIIAPASSMEINTVWLMQPGGVGGTPDQALGSLTGNVRGSVSTFHMAAANSSSSPGGM